jgi:GH25 family lysozyme M1 (1,4-beta-N-acetylmuramidase)
MNLAVTKTKAQYGIMRLGYGTQWKDPNADTYYRDAQVNDFPVGAYWYCKVGEDVTLSMKSFAEEIATHRPQVGIWLDIEQSSLDPGTTLNWVKNAYELILGLTNIKPGIYTAPWIWNAKVARSSYWSGKEHWAANWTTRDTPTLSLDWYAWSHWQHSADGNRKATEYGMVSGGDPDMDLDRFNGNCVQFNAKYGTHIKPIGDIVTPPPIIVPPPVVIPPVGLPEYVIISSYANPISELSIHSAPLAAPSNVIGHALKDTKWYVVGQTTTDIEWWQVGPHAYISKKYCRLS